MKHGRPGGLDQARQAGLEIVEPEAPGSTA
jgi:hypothetical protein